MRENFELKAQDKSAVKMTKDGLIEQNKTTGIKRNISKRNREFNIKNSIPDETDLSDSGLQNLKQLGALDKPKLAIDVKNAKANIKDNAKAVIRKKQVIKYHKQKANKLDVKNSSATTIQQPSLTHSVSEQTKVFDAPSTNTTTNEMVSTTIIREQSLTHEIIAEKPEELVRSDVSQSIDSEKPKSSSRKLNFKKTEKNSHDKVNKLISDDDINFPSEIVLATEQTQASETADNKIKATDKYKMPKQTHEPTSMAKAETIKNKRFLKHQQKSGIDKQNKLQFSNEESAVEKSIDDKALPKELPVETKKLEKARTKTEISVKKLAEAQKKLPHKQKIIFDKQYDANAGKPLKKLRFENEIKSQKEHIKGSLPLRPVKAIANLGINYAHMKIHQVQDENVGIEAAHKAEIVAEHGLRRAYQIHKTAPYRKVAKLEKQVQKHEINYSFQKALHDNPSPELNSNVVSRFMQKQKIKKDYAKKARDTQNATSIAKKTTKKAFEAAQKAAVFIYNNPAVAGIIVMCVIFIFLLFSIFSSLSSVATSGLSSIATVSYLASEKDIDNAELYYTEWETDLLLEAQNARSSYPGFDEYIFNIGDISHDPYELMAFLTIKYSGFSFSEIEVELFRIFEEQYSITFTEKTVTRYTEDDEPYEARILTVNLTARSFSNVISGRLSGDEIKRFNALMVTKGNRQCLDNVFDFNWLYKISNAYGYRVHPISGDKEYHKGIDIALPTGTPIKAGHGGIVTYSGSNGGYGLVIGIEDDNGLVSKYAHCSEVLFSVGQEVKKGDIVAKSGNTGYSMGSHLHLEIIKNGLYLNPIYFADTGDDGSGRLMPGSPGGITFGNPGTPMGDGSYAALIEEAERFLGYPYVWGGSSPATSFDCSGYICYILKQSGVKDLGRTTAQGLFNACIPISSNDAMPGDLIFFTGTYSTANPVTHVGLYVGGGTMIHCGDPIQYTSINTNYWQNCFYAYGRLN